MEHGALLSEEIVQVLWMLGNKEQGTCRQHSMTDTVSRRRVGVSFLLL